ncbi:hypothetical protein BDZ85DRAFT_315452 [Elsinoe ampelina]|uniref:Uncharacterized protein n=1 Tax=Elsinoe ampelina TaxID=302913 RepID=A0A6A6GQC2_9PEZI|nr:hypothetical protein BDZ85DRAFT_315452 [Elsinoe ampelina]
MAPVAYTMHTYDHSLHTAALELKYERSVHLVDIIAKEEGIRKLRFDNHVLEDDNVELRDLLSAEQERCEKMESMMNEHLLRAEEAEAAVHGLEEELQAKEQEVSSLRAESKALKNLTTDTSKIMTEKLELTHELSRLKPEIEHLRTQATANEGLLTDKLGLQRRISEMEVDLENAKRDAKRALAKRRNTMVEAAQEDEMENLKKSLAKEKRLHERAKETIEEMQAELDEIKKSSARDTAAETHKVEKNAEAEVRAQALARDLAKEQKEKIKAEKALQKAQKDWEGTKTVLEDKLTQYKNRTRTLKDRLNETETSLEQAQAAAAQAATAAPNAAKSTAAAAKKAGKQGTKRAANQMDPDATTLGTPGDAPTKRARKGASVGEKSSFSITPFLNRTMSIAPDSPDAAKDDSSASEAEADMPTTTSPTGATKKPLQPVPSTKQNIKKPPTTLTAKTTKIPLQPVAEETEPISPHKAPVPNPRPQKKMRKSLAHFAAFALDPEGEVETKKKKKPKARKLGGLGRTLFDEEDDAPVKAMPGGGGGRGLFGGVAGGKMGPLAGGLGLARGSFLGGVGRGAQRSEDGFVFSPLKRERKAGASFLK